jgi:hypothetical protein
MCKIDGVIGKEIGFSVWLPDAWNGKFVMGGQGGFAGRVESQAMTMQALQKGYATAGTDTGHSSPPRGIDGAWASGDYERVANYAHAAIHRTSETAKALLVARYGNAIPMISTASSPARPPSTSRASRLRSRPSRRRCIRIRRRLRRPYSTSPRATSSRRR